MSCPQFQNQPMDGMTYPDGLSSKTAQEVLETVSEILGGYLENNSEQIDMLLPIMYEINAQVMRALIYYQPRADHDIHVGLGRKDPGPALARIIHYAALRAASLCEDALAHYEDGWRLEIIKRGPAQYARWRRSNGSGKRETKYLGVVVSARSVIRVNNKFMNKGP